MFDSLGGVDDDTWHDAQPLLPEISSSATFDEVGKLRANINAHGMFCFDVESHNTMNKM